MSWDLYNRMNYLQIISEILCKEKFDEYKLSSFYGYLNRELRLKNQVASFGWDQPKRRVCKRCFSPIIINHAVDIVNNKVETGKNAARERTRVKSLRLAFQRLQSSIPTIPPDTKLSKLDILVLAANYISHLGNILANDGHISNSPIFLHPIKKWPMRSRLYPVLDSIDHTKETDNSEYRIDSNESDCAINFGSDLNWEIGLDFWNNDLNVINTTFFSE